MSQRIIRSEFRSRFPGYIGERDFYAENLSMYRETELLWLLHNYVKINRDGSAERVQTEQEYEKIKQRMLRRYRRHSDPHLLFDIERGVHLSPDYKLLPSTYSVSIGGIFYRKQYTKEIFCKRVSRTKEFRVKQKDYRDGGFNVTCEAEDGTFLTFFRNCSDYPTSFYAGHFDPSSTLQQEIVEGIPRVIDAFDRFSPRMLDSEVVKASIELALENDKSEPNYEISGKLKPVEEFVAAIGSTLVFGPSKTF